MQILPFTVVRDIALDINGDWDVSNGDLQLIGDGPAIVQAVKQAIWSFQGEWFLNLDEGMPWYQTILIANPDVNQVVGAFRKAILSVDGVQSIQSLTLTWDKQLRQLTVDFAVLGNAELLPGSITLGGPQASPALPTTSTGA